MKRKEQYHTVRGYELLKREKKLLTDSMEDYLEMIYRQSLREDHIRMNVLASLLNVQVSSATKMVQKLSRLGLVHYQKYGIIYLTDKGREIGEFLFVRHNIIVAFLKLLGVEERILANVEMIEHGVGIHALKQIHLLNSFFDANPPIKEKFEAFQKEEMNKIF